MYCRCSWLFLSTLSNHSVSDNDKGLILFCVFLVYVRENKHLGIFQMLPYRSFHLLWGFWEFPPFDPWDERHPLPPSTPGRGGPNDPKQCLCGLWCFSKPLNLQVASLSGEVFFEMLQWSCFVLVVVCFSRCKIFQVNSLISNMVLG